MPKTIMYEDESIVIKDTGRDYNFIITIENKTDRTIVIKPGKDVDCETFFESFELPPLDWVGIYANDEGFNTKRAIKQNKFIILKEDL